MLNINNFRQGILILLVHVYVIKSSEHSTIDKISLKNNFVFKLLVNICYLKITTLRISQIMYTKKFQLNLSLSTENLVNIFFIDQKVINFMS